MQYRKFGKLDWRASAVIPVCKYQASAFIAVSKKPQNVEDAAEAEWKKG